MHSELHAYDASPASDPRILRRRRAAQCGGIQRCRLGGGVLMTTDTPAGSDRRVTAAGLPGRVIVPAPPAIRVLPGVPESATAARRLTRQLLGDDHPVADTAMLLMSELVTNSVLHSRSQRPGGTVTVAVCAGLTSVLIQVRDDGGPFEPRSPAAAGAGETGSGAEHGYGLLLVDALAETWGTSATTDGRVTWCRLAIR